MALIGRGGPREASETESDEAHWRTMISNLKSLFFLPGTLVPHEMSIDAANIFPIVSCQVF